MGERGFWGVKAFWGSFLVVENCLGVLGSGFWGSFGGEMGQCFLSCVKKTVMTILGMPGPVMSSVAESFTFSILEKIGQERFEG